MGRAANRGFTLVELMIVLVVAAILLMVTVPSFVNMFTRMRVEGTGNELSADLQYARTEALRRRAAVSLTTSGTGYLITTPDPAGGGTPLQLKGVVFATGVSIAEGTVTVSYDAMRAMANAADVTLSAAGGATQLRVTTNVMGRVQMCSPGHTLPSYPSC